jgi:hypothetical protein
MFSSTLFFAYFSPETMLPLSSLIATIAGFALFLRRSSMRFVVHCCRESLRRLRPDARSNSPHFAMRGRRSTQRTRP